MNTTTAKCGHSVIAVGAPNSDARKKCENEVCNACQQPVTIGTLIDLACIGRNYILEQHKNGVIMWLGTLPSEEKLKNEIASWIYHAMNGYGKIESQEIYDTING